MKNRYDKVESTKTIAFVHHKGGTGKTTSCLNIAGWMTKMGKNVLVVDLDPQGNATTGLGVDRSTLDGSIYDLIFTELQIEDVILETDSGVFLVPSSLDLLAAETQTDDNIPKMDNLKKKLNCVGRCFDYILIDVPSGSTLFMICGITVSENIIIPLDSSVFAYETLETLKALIVDIDKGFGVETNIMMILLKEPSAWILDCAISMDIKKLLKGFLDKNNISTVKIFTIPFSARQIYGSQIKGMPISHFASHSKVGIAYERVAKEIIETDYRQ